MRVDRARMPREDAGASLRRILANTPMFRVLDDVQLDAVAAATCAMRLPGNARVVSQGDTPKGMYLVVYGQVRLGFDRPDGGEKTLAILGQNKCFGLIETVLDQEYLATARTSGDTMLLHMPPEVVTAAAWSNPEFARELMVCVSRQSYTLVRDIEEYSLRSARQRLASYLLRHAPEREGAYIELSVGKNVVASRLSLTPETFSRLLHELSREGIVSVIGRRIRVLDNARLSAVAA